MVKVLFAGPSLSGAEPDLVGVDLRPPAQHGDLALAVLQGATAIGLVDGLFDAVAAVWHKEILFALSEGVHVLGAASMGALRAAECAAFGMQPIGPIALSYADGSRDDDADVGLVHGPAELGYLPLTEPMVDVEATLAELARRNLLLPGERLKILDHARGIFFGHRTVDDLIPPALASRREALLAAYAEHRVPQKQRDALALVDALKALPDTRSFVPAFTFVESPMWRRRLAEIQHHAGITTHGVY